VALIFDTGPLYAALDRSDSAHAISSGLLIRANQPFIVPAPVLVEVDWLLQRNGLLDVSIRLQDDIVAGLFRVEDLKLQDYVRISAILTQYSDTPIGFVDAAVPAIVERLGETRLATLDRRHFGLLRPSHVNALTLIPEPP
jgi:predicted nucleic acid-binding protein